MTVKSSFEFLTILRFLIKFFNEEFKSFYKKTQRSASKVILNRNLSEKDDENFGYFLMKKVKEFYHLGSNEFVKIVSELFGFEIMLKKLRTFFKEKIQEMQSKGQDNFNDKDVGTALGMFTSIEDYLKKISRKKFKNSVENSIEISSLSSFFTFTISNDLQELVEKWIDFYDFFEHFEAFRVTPTTINFLSKIFRYYPRKIFKTKFSRKISSTQSSKKNKLK